MCGDLPHFIIILQHSTQFLLDFNNNISGGIIMMMIKNKGKMKEILSLISFHLNFRGCSKRKMLHVHAFHRLLLDVSGWEYQVKCI